MEESVLSDPANRTKLAIKRRSRVRSRESQICNHGHVHIHIIWTKNILHADTDSCPCVWLNQHERDVQWLAKVFEQLSQTAIMYIACYIKDFEIALTL